MAKSAKDYARDYTDPELRERLKSEIKDSDRGGRKGQWSARKSQLLTQEYERHGGGYEHSGEKTQDQKNLEEWTDQDWQTADGSTRARDGDTTDRYLPRRAWEEMSDSEKRETRKAKKADSEKGRQHSANTEAARSARADAELDSVNAAEAVRRAGKMDPDQASTALEHEDQNKSRKTVMQRLRTIAGRRKS